MKIGGGIIELLTASGSSMKKKEVVDHFKDRYDKSAVYRELKKLVVSGQVNECNGTVTMANHNGADECEPIPNTSLHQG